MSKSKSSKKESPELIKRTIKYLSSSLDSDIVQIVLKKSPSGVIRAISNAALNARQGEVQIPQNFLGLFKHHHRNFDILCDRQVPIARKREILTQRGGALPLVVPLLATVLGSLGGEFISRIFNK